MVCIPPTASSHSTAPLRPAILPAERANFDQLYIIQQGGRGITREQVINRLQKEPLKPDNLMEVFKIIRSNPQLNRDLLKNIRNENEALEKLIGLIQDSKSVIYTSVLTTR